MTRVRQLSAKDISIVILYFLLFFAPLAIGGVHDVTLIAAALLSFFILFFYLIDRHLKDKHFFISRFFYIFAGFAAFVFLQIIPLPDFIVSFLSPKTAGIYKDSAVANGEAPPSFYPLSIAPFRTVIDFIKIVGAAFLFLGVMNLSRREARGRRILRAVCYSAGAVILTGLLHFLTGAKEILWFYKPQKDLAHSLFFTTFVNENNLAGFMNLAFFLSVGFIFDRQGKQNKAIFFLLAMSCLLAIIFTSSRGGLSALTAGALVFTAFYLIGRLKGRGGIRGARYLITPVFITMFAIFVLFYMLYDAVFRGAENLFSLTDQIRTSLIAHSIPAIGDFPLTGSGKGSFAFIFPQYWDLPSPKRFVHLENEPLQLILECGIPFGVFLIVAAIALFVRLFSKVSFKPLKLGALTGVLAVCIASLADFAMEYAGTSVALITVLGAVYGLDLRRQIHDSKVVERIVKPRILVITLAAFFIPAVALSAVLLFAYSGKNQIFNPADCESFLVRGNKLMNEKRPDEAEPLLKRAHELCPTYFSTSLAWAKLLIVKKEVKGAGTEIREILENYPAKSEKVFDAIFNPRNKPAVYAGLLADERHSILFADYLDKKRLERYLEGFLLEKISLKRDYYGVTAVLTRFYIEKERLDKASEFAGRIYTEDAGNPEGAYLMGVVLKKQGRVFEAYHMFIEALRLYSGKNCNAHKGGGDDERCGRLDSNFGMELLAALVEVSIMLKEEKKAEEFLERMRNEIIENRYYLMKYRQLNASLLTLRGEYSKAFGELGVALKISPENSSVLLQYAELCEKVGNIDGAIFYYNKLLAKGKRFDWVKVRIGKLEAMKL